MQKHAGVQIYSLNRDSDDSGISLKRSVTTSIAFTNKTIERSTAAVEIEKETPTPAVLSDPWNNRKPLRYKGGSSEKQIQIINKNIETFLKIITFVSNDNQIISNFLVGEIDANYTQDEDENDSTVFAGIGGFIVAACVLMAIALLIYQRSKKPVSGSKELINEGTNNS